MIPEKLRKLLELLLQRTINKTAIWNRGSADNQFKLSIAQGAAVTIIYWPADHNDPDMYVVTVYNASGFAIENFNTLTDTASAESFELLKHLHKAASDQYYKVEETMDALLISLAGEEIIGNSEEYQPPTEEEDDSLPF